MSDIIFDALNLIKDIQNYDGSLQEFESVRSLSKMYSVCKIAYAVYVDSANTESKVIFEDSSKTIGQNYDFSRTTVENRKLVIRIYRSSDAAALSEHDQGTFDLFGITILNAVCLERLIESRQLAYYYDAATDTTNTSYFMMNLNKLIKANTISSYFVGFLNIKSCHTLNNLFGNQITEKFINKYAQTISAKCNEELRENLSHLGGDKFAFVIHEDNVQEFADFIKSIHISVEDKDDLLTYTMNCRAGIVRCDYTKSASDLIDSASDIYKRTRLPDANDVIISEIENVVIDLTEQSFINDFRNDFEAGKLLVYYQPIYESIDSLRVMGAEALVRWRRSGELVSPASFISVAEKLNIICDIDLFVLGKACENLKSWIDEGINVVPISVNFSHYDLLSTNIAEKIIEIIDSYGIAHNLITIEFKEAGYHQEYEALQYTVTTLRKSGVSVCIDNYGVGYSSFSLLKELNINILKISPKIINSDDPKTLIVLQSIIELAHKLGINVICQGIESAEKIDSLKSFGCNIFQAEIYSKALSERFFLSQIKKN